MKNNVKLGLITLTGIFGAASIAAAAPTTVVTPNIGSSLQTPATLPTYVAARATPKHVDVKKRPATIISKRSQWFLKLDANHDGFVTRAELSRGTPANVRSRFERLDTNRDGKLTMAEATAPAPKRCGMEGPRRKAKAPKKLDAEGRAKHDAAKARGRRA